MLPLFTWLFLYSINQDYGIDSNPFNLPIVQSTDRPIYLSPNRPIEYKTKSKNILAITMAECSGCELRNIILYSGEKSKEKQVSGCKLSGFSLRKYKTQGAR